MQGILYLIVFAACFELSIARPKLKTVGMKAYERPRPGHHQAGGSSATLHHKADHPYPTKPLPSPCSSELMFLEGMNLQSEVSAPTRGARAFFAKDTKRPAGEKSSRTVRASWSTSSHDTHRSIRRRPPRMSRKDSQRLLNTPKNRNVLRKWRRGSPRAKRSVTQGTTVQYSGFKDVKFRMQGRLPLYLTPASSGNSLSLNTQYLNHSCFRAHIFENVISSTEGGLVVMLQAHTGSYLHANSSGFLSLVGSEAGAATVTQVDNRFFRLHSYTGDSVVRIKHIVTNLHLQATGNTVSLASTDPLAAEGMHFYEYNCSTT